MSDAYFNLSGGNFFQDWSNPNLITTNDDWSGVPSIVGYRGDDITSATGADPRTLTGDGTVTIDVNANQTATTFTTGGVTEFALANPTIALTGSGTADAPNIVLYLNAAGRQNLHLELDVRDIEAGDNTTQQFNIQYRVGPTGAWTNLPGGYIADATDASNTLVTHLSIDLPAALSGQSQVQLRFMTTNAPGNDEWIGVDNISVTSQPQAGSAVAINNVSISEGDAGDKVMTFEVTRGGDSTSDFTVDFATSNGTATAGSDYVAAQGTIHFTPGGPNTQTVSVTIHGDTDVEPTETFNVTLSNVVATTGSATIQGSGVGVGSITNDDVSLLKTYQIQGAGHLSPFNGAHVTVEGVVTAIDTTGARGFWIQDPTGDGNDATSDAVFVFTGAVPTVTVGQTVRVEGDVNEFRGSDPNNLPVTEIDTPTVTVLNGGAISALPAAVIMGTGGRLPPTEIVDNDGNTTYDPTTDALDFYETLEGMRVTVPDAQATGPTSGNSTWIVGNQGANATGMNAAGGITISAGDMNPERIQIFYDSGVSPAGVQPNAVTGDHLGDVTGIFTYFGGDYELIPTAIGSTGSGPIVLPKETTTLRGDAEHLTVGALNVENLDPTDSQAKFDALAANIVTNLGAPDIVGLEEVQDADGPGNGTNYSGHPTADKLIAAIKAAGGPNYAYVEVAPTANNVSGGESNGNIRQGYLYNTDRVDFVSVSQITDTTPANGDTYANSRKPLVGVFEFEGERITLVDVHNTSRLGSEGMFGQHQPANNEGDARRIEQTSFVKSFVEGLVAGDPGARVVVMGDFNAFQFETSLTQLESGGALTNLTNLLAVNERYSYNFDGNNQQIDHMLASPELYAGAQFDIVHINSNQAVVNQTSDHDGSVARFFINFDPTAVADTAAVNENQNVTIDVLANDTDRNVGDTKTLIGVSGGALGGAVSIVNGKVVYSANSDAIDALKQPQTAVDTITYQVRDGHGAVSTGTVSVTVKGVADAPTRNGTANADTMNGTALEDVLNGLGGHDKLVGNAGADTLNGGAGNDTLTGGVGADRFVFSGTFGTDVVTDFESNDVIQLDAAQFANFAAVQSHAAQVGLDTVITLDAANTITLTGVSVASLNAGDFLFV